MSAMTYTRDEPHVAILMRTVGKSALLARALSSVLAQKHKNWHLYLMDSSPVRANVPELVSRYQTSFGARISVLQVPRGKDVSSMSSALTALFGDQVPKYLTSINEEDTWDANMLLRCCARLEAESLLAAVATKFKYVVERKYGDQVFTVAARSPHEDQDAHEFYISIADIARMDSLPPISMVMRASTAAKVGRLSDLLTHYGQWDYQLKVLAQGDIAVLADVLAYKHKGDEDKDEAKSEKAAKEQASNELLRSYLKDKPENLGVVHLVEANHQRMLVEFGRLHARLDEQKRVSAELLASLHSLAEEVKRKPQPKWKFWRS